MGDQEKTACGDLTDDVFKNTGRPVEEVLQEKYTETQVPSAENTTCADFNEYKEVPKIISLDSMVNDVTWVTSKLSDATGTLSAEAIDMRDRLIRFGCTPE